MATNFNGGGVRSVATILEAKDNTAPAYQSALDRANSYARAVNREVGGSLQQATQSAQIFSQVASGGFRQSELSAKQLTFAARQLPAQFTDIVVSLQAGQPVLQVLLQQGGQIKDLYGGIGNALRGLAGYVASLINPYTLLGGAAVAVGVGFVRSASATDQFNKSLILSGRSAELNAQQLQRASEQAGRLSGSYGNASEAVLELAKNSRFTFDQIQQGAVAAALGARLLGEDVGKMTDRLNQLAGDPVKGVQELDKAFKFLNAGQLSVIQNLQATGQEAKATAMAFDLAVKGITSKDQQVADTLTWWGSLLRILKKEAEDVARGFRIAFNLEPPKSALEQLRTRERSLSQSPGFETYVARESRLQQLEDVRRQISTAEKLNTEANRYIETQNRLKKAEEDVLALGDTRMQQQAKIIEQYKQVAMLVDAGKLSPQLADERYAQLAQRFKGTIESSGGGAASSGRTRTGSVRDIAGEESAFRAKQANEFMEQSMKAQERLAQIQQQILVEDEQARVESMEKLQKIQEEIYLEDMQRFRKDAEEKLKIQQRQAEQYQREFERVSDNISRSLTDALMRGFESGKDFIKNFRDALVNMFRTTVLQPVIKAVLDTSGVTGFATSIGQAFGGASQAGLTNDPNTSVISRIGRVFEIANTASVTAIKDFAGSIANGMNGTIDKFARLINKNASLVAKGLVFTDAAFKLLSGDVRGAAFSGAGAGIGLALSAGNPLGGAIGSFVGNLVGGLFGKKSPPLTGDQVTGRFTNNAFTSSSNVFGRRSLGAGNTLADLSKAFSTQLGTLLTAFDPSASFNTNAIYRNRTNQRAFFSVNSDTVYSNKNAGMEDFIKGALGVGFVKALQQFNLPQAIKDLFAGITDAEVVQTMVGTVSALNKSNNALTDAFGLTAVQTAKVALESGLAGAELSTLLNAIVATANASRKTSLAMLQMKDDMTAALGSRGLFANLVEFDTALKNIDKSTDAGIKAFYDLFKLREQFASYQNAFDGVRSSVSDAIFTMLSPAEQFAENQRALAKAFSELNLSVPGSVQELINLGKGIDYTTEAGLDLALAFPTLVEMFNKTSEGVKQLTSDLSASYFTTLADFRVAQNSQNPTDYIKSQAETNTAMLDEIKQLKAENMDMKALMMAVAEYTFKFERVLDDWDKNGMPAVRVD